MKILNDPEGYAAAISAAWNKSVESILEVARLCAEADKQLSAGQKAELLEQLPFEAPTFSKLVKIGNDARLRSDDMRSRLPPSYSIMYEVALCSGSQLEHAIESGALHSGASRSEIEAVRKAPPTAKRATLPLFDDVQRESVAAGGAPSLQIERVCFAELYTPRDYPPEQRERLAEELTRVAESYGIELVRRLTPEERAEVRYGKALNAFADRWTRAGRKLARQRINDLKRNRRQQNKRWGFAPDETELDLNAGWDRIEEVFDFLGLEDEIDGLRAQAEALAKAPDLPAELAEPIPTDQTHVTQPDRRIAPDPLADWNFENDLENFEKELGNVE